MIQKHFFLPIVDLTRSSNNQLIRILATSLLNSICTCGDLYVERFDKLNGPINLLAMLLPRDNTGNFFIFVTLSTYIHMSLEFLATIVSSGVSGPLIIIQVHPSLKFYFYPPWHQIPPCNTPCNLSDHMIIFI